MYQKADALEHLIGRRESKRFHLLAAATLLCGILLLWQLLSDLGVLPEWNFSRPSAIFEEAWSLETRGRDTGGYYYLHDHLFSSFRRIFPSLILGSIIGYLGAIYLSLYPKLLSVAIIVALILAGTSATALFVVFQFFWPGGETPKWLIMFWIALSFSYALTFWRTQRFFREAQTGSDQDTKELVDWLASIGTSRWYFFKDHLVSLFREMYFHSLRVGSFICWKLTVFTEGYGGDTSGIGAIVRAGESEAEASLLYTGVVVLFLCTSLTWGLIWLLERWMYPRKK